MVLINRGSASAVWTDSLGKSQISPKSMESLALATRLQMTGVGSRNVDVDPGVSPFKICANTRGAFAPGADLRHAWSN